MRLQYEGHKSAVIHSDALPAGDLKRMARYIRRQRGCEAAHGSISMMAAELIAQEHSQKHRCGCFIGVGCSTEGDGRRATRRVLRLGNTQRNLLAVDLDGRAIF